MASNKLLKRAGIISLCILIGLILISCGRTAPAEPASLPPGFEASRVPGMDTVAFVYASQGAPFYLPDEAVSVAGEVAISSVSAWALSTETAGAQVSFSSPEGAKETFDGLQGDFWKYIDQDQLFVVYGPETEKLKDSILSDGLVSLKEARPEVWETMNRLPAVPPGSPVAAGYVMATGELLQLLSKLVEGDELQALSLLDQFPFVDHAVFALYAGQGVVLSDGISLEDLEGSGVGGIIVAKSNLPGFVTGPGFRTFADDFGLEESGDAYYMSQDGIHLTVKPGGSYVYIAFAASREGAAQLLASAVGS